ncbi:hypothetical protein [Yersinia alsatica]|uniref:hypothetical protein n=1 Tax=Yersinia alsatica TaxID=2890317 RepID=UPI001643C260|nr:hypothetical protein [Yersinia alsatica]
MTLLVQWLVRGALSQYQQSHSVFGSWGPEGYLVSYPVALALALAVTSGLVLPVVVSEYQFLPTPLGY